MKQAARPNRSAIGSPNLPARRYGVTQHDGIRRALLENDAALLREIRPNGAANGKGSGALNLTASPESLSPSWPEPLRPAAFHGPAGELVRLIEPHSEADPQRF